jgi:hypothetical protein
MYSAFGRPSIAPEKLLKALLLQVLYTVRSERMLMELLSVIRKRCFLSFGRAEKTPATSSAPKARFPVNHQHQNISIRNCIVGFGRR